MASPSVTQRFVAAIGDLTRIFVRLATCGLLAPSPEERPLLETELSVRERERIRDAILRLEQDIDELGGVQIIKDVSSLLDQAFGGPEQFVRSVSAWVNLVDTLILEAEREFGSASGRGGPKRRLVKGTLLYLARRSAIDLPDIPAFLEPFVWDAVLDPLIAVLVEISNQHKRFGDVPKTPSLRARARIGAQHVAGVVESFSLLLAGWTWALVMFLQSTSKPMRATVDAFLKETPDLQKTAKTLLTWVLGRTHEIAVLANMLGIFLVEARFAIDGDPARRKVYARELTLAFLENSVGIPPDGSLRMLLLSAAVDFGIEILSRLFEKRPPGHRPPIEAPTASPAANAKHTSSVALVRVQPRGG